MEYPTNGYGESAADRRRCPEDERERARELAISRSHHGGSSGSRRDRKGLLGLSNLGNTCFMNAALQCLSHTHGLQKYFRTCSHEYTSKGPSSRQKLLMSFANWFERDWGEPPFASYHSPEDILRNVQQLNPIFQGYAQQDSQEFLRCVLDNIHEELRREVPSDLRGHLLEVFGAEAADLAFGSSSASGSRTSRPMEGVTAEPEGSPRPVKRSPSAAASSSRPFMQLCQTTEAATDVGEIRLPTARQSAGVGTAAGRLPGGGAEAAASAEDSCSMAGSSPSGAPAASASPSGCVGTSPSCSPSVPCGASSSSMASPSAGSAADGERRQQTGEAAGKRGEKATHYASVISDIFQGHVVSTVRCLECQRTSRTEEPIYDVSVQIPTAADLATGAGPDVSRENSRGGGWTSVFGNVTGKVKSLFYDKGVEVSDCLRKFCAPEALTGKDKYDCEFCKRKTEGERRFAFKDLPEVLCVHIKRFRYDASWFNAQKNSRVVSFPANKTLDMGPFLEDPPAHPVEYRLIGLIQHIGSMGGGHYISYCLHKRKPQVWYEFDDMQVSHVSAEQVERAEPYVLFFQRVASKASKLDRQTFKKDLAQTEANISRQLFGRPSAPLTQATDVMRFRGEPLRALYRNPPAELDVAFISKRWYVRLLTQSNPGPIDNYEHLCPHGLFGCTHPEMAAEPFMPISHHFYQALVQKYGGGPAIRALEICPKCQAHIRAYNDRKQAELDLVSKYDTKDTADGEAWYLVDNVWVNKWKRYVRSENVNDIHDIICPGPVANGRLLDKHGNVRSGLRLKSDYIGVNARVWWLFMHLHSGGPALCRRSLDLYSESHPLETDLVPEEFRLTGPSADFARRTSHAFVDECKADMELYEQRYGTGRQDDVAM